MSNIHTRYIDPSQSPARPIASRRNHSLNVNEHHAPPWLPSQLNYTSLPQNSLPTARPESSRTANRKPATYDGSSSWKDYLVQFDLIADLNHWSAENKALELAAALRGQAQSILSDLSLENRKSLSHLIEALTIRFKPENQMEIYQSQLKTRLRKKGEDLATLAQDLMRLVRKAYPSVSPEMKDKFAMDAFMDALNDSDLEWSVYQGHPKSLHDASKLAHEYEAFRMGRGKRSLQGGKIRFQRTEKGNTNDLTSYKDVHESLLKEIK